VASVAVNVSTNQQLVGVAMSKCKNISSVAQT